MSKELWSVVAEPEGKNPGPIDKAKALVGANVDNVGGIVFYVQKGIVKQEVAAVGYIRRASQNPETSFKDQLKVTRQLADEACAVLNAGLEGGMQ